MEEKLNGVLEELMRHQSEIGAITSHLYNVIEVMKVEDKNTQPQTEGEKTFEQLREEFDKERIKEWDKTAVETYKQATESTPEQKEEWGKELGKLMSTWGKVLFVNEGRIGVGMQPAMYQPAMYQPAMYLEFYHFIKNLLSEREREVLETIKELVDGKSIYSNNGCGTPLELIEWFVDTELDKLSKKK